MEWPKNMQQKYLNYKALFYSKKENSILINELLKQSNQAILMIEMLSQSDSQIKCSSQSEISQASSIDSEQTALDEQIQQVRKYWSRKKIQQRQLYLNLQLRHLLFRSSLESIIAELQQKFESNQQNNNQFNQILQEYLNYQIFFCQEELSQKLMENINAVQNTGNIISKVQITGLKQRVREFALSRIQSGESSIQQRQKTFEKQLDRFRNIREQELNQCSEIIQSKMHSYFDNCKELMNQYKKIRELQFAQYPTKNQLVIDQLQNIKTSFKKNIEKKFNSINRIIIKLSRLLRSKFKRMRQWFVTTYFRIRKCQFQLKRRRLLDEIAQYWKQQFDRIKEHEDILDQRIKLVIAEKTENSFQGQEKVQIQKKKQQKRTNLGKQLSNHKKPIKKKKVIKRKIRNIKFLRLF